jgi:ribosomal protein S27E
MRPSGGQLLTSSAGISDDSMSGYGLPDWVRCPECNHPCFEIVTFPRSTVGMKCGYCGEKTIEIVRSIGTNGSDG